MKGRPDHLAAEARRLQAGGYRQRLTVDLSGAALDAWEALGEKGKGKGITPGGVLTLLLTYASARVDAALDALPAPRASAAKAHQP